MQRVICSLVLGVFSALNVSAGFWQSVDSSWDGLFSDSRHWNGGFALQGGVNTINSQNAPNGLTVSVDAATDITGTVSLGGRSDRPVILDVRGASLCFATQTVNSVTWPANAYSVTFDGQTFLTQNSDDARWSKMAQAKLTDVTVKIWSPEAGVAEMLVTGGTTGGIFDFVHPDSRGDTKAPNGARPTVRLFESSYYKPSGSSYNHARLAFTDTDVYLPSLIIGNQPQVTELSASGGSVSVFGTAHFGALTNRVTLMDGATFDISRGQFGTLAATSGRTEFLMNKISSARLSTVTVPDTVTFQVEGGRVTSSVLDVFKGSGSGRIELKDTVVEGTAEMRFLLEGNSELVADNTDFSTAGKFLFKATDDAQIILTNGSLTASQVVGDDGSNLSLNGTKVEVGAFGLSNAMVDMSGVMFVGGGFGMTGDNASYMLTNVLGETSLDGATAIGGSEVTIGGTSSLIVHSGGNHAILGTSATHDGVLTIDGGTFEYQPKATTSLRFNLGHGNASAVGRLNVNGGRFVSKVTAEGKRMFGLGITHGTGYITVSGGELDVSGLCFCTEENATAQESVFRQSGGLVKVAGGAYDASCQSWGLCATGNNKKTRKARIILDGGVTETSVIAGGTSGQCRGGTGWTAFEADGGFVRVNHVNAEILRDFDEATIGADGLTLDSNGYAVTVRQNLSSKSGVAGWLRLTGRGKKTVAGANAVAIVADGGEVEFAATADNSAVDLTATNGVTLTFAKGGANNRNFRSLVLKNINISIADAVETGSTYVLIVSDSDLSAESKMAWRRAHVLGLADNQACDLTIEESDGRQFLKMSVRVRETQTLSVESGATRTVTDDIIYATSEKLVSEVGAQGSLTVTGCVGNGALEKTGTGRAIFDNPDDFFAGGVKVFSGLLALPYTKSLADLDGTTLMVGTGTLELGYSGGAPDVLTAKLTVSPAQPSEAAVVKCNSDVTVATASAFNGCLVKRGVGTLTLHTDETCTFSSNAGMDKKGVMPLAEPIVFDAFGTPPQSNYSSLTVAEGDLVLQGAFETAKYSMSGAGAVYIGMPVPDIAKPARLVIDGVAAEFKGSHFHVGSAVQKNNCACPDSTFVVTNGAQATVTSLRLGWNSAQAGKAHVCVTGEGTILTATEYLYLADSTYPNGSEEDPALVVSDGAILQMPRMNDGNINHALACVNQKAVGVFDDATLQGADGHGARITAAASATDARLVFRNGSLCKVDEVRPADDRAFLTMTFDDSEWAFETLTLIRPERIAVKARGRGLVLNAPGGETKTFPLTISGDGGLVKTGDGTLVLSAVPECAGTCCIEAGELQLAEGLVASELTFSGSGKLTAGRFLNTTLLAPLGDSGMVTGAVPVVAGAMLMGRTRIDLAHMSVPLVQPYPKDLLVATYEGEAPDVSNWRAVNTGAKGVVGKFTAANGEIRMSLERRGIIVIFR